MDFLQDWLPRALHLQDPSTASIAASSGTVQSALAIFYMLQNYTVSLISYISSAQPSLTSLALLLLILYLSLQILNMAWRAVKFWVALVTQLVVLGGIVGVVLWAWSRGPEGVLEDAKYWGGMWWEEYQRQQRHVEAMQGPGGVGREGVYDGYGR